MLADLLLQAAVCPCGKSSGPGQSASEGGGCWPRRAEAAGTDFCRRPRSCCFAALESHPEKDALWPGAVVSTVASQREGWGLQS